MQARLAVEGLLTPFGGDKEPLAGWPLPQEMCFLKRLSSMYCLELGAIVGLLKGGKASLSGAELDAYSLNQSPREPGRVRDQNARVSKWEEA